MTYKPTCFKKMLYQLQVGVKWAKTNQVRNHLSMDDSPQITLKWVRIMVESAKMYTETWNLKVWLFDDNLQSRWTKKTMATVYLKTSFQSKVLLMCTIAARCPRTSWGQVVKMVPITFHAFTFGLLPLRLLTCQVREEERERESERGRLTKTTHASSVTTNHRQLMNPHQHKWKQQNEPTCTSSGKYCRSKNRKMLNEFGPAGDCVGA